MKEEIVRSMKCNSIVHIKKNISIPQEQPNNPPIKAKIVKSLHLINKRELEQELAQESHAYAVILTLDSSSQQEQHPVEVQLLLQELVMYFQKNSLTSYHPCVMFNTL